MNQFVQAKLINYRTIRVSITHPNKYIHYIFTFVSGNSYRYKLNGKALINNERELLCEFKLDEDIQLGIAYHIAITNLGTFPLNVNELALLPDFDDRFAYDGDDLGSTYSRSHTDFALWAPLASSVTLYLDNEKTYEMKRTDRGVYRVSVPGNLKGHIYNYFVSNSGITTKTIDPYAKASTLNSKNSVILDFKSYEINMHDRHPDKMNSYLDAIIYEGSVRDLTSDPSTTIKNKGKFLGLVEENCVNEDGLPVGFDYIKSLGITHLQLLPIYDFATTDEEHPESTYNWGYDPIQYFVPEGSYASKLEDPSSRIKDLLKLVSKFHEAKIRVVMDVVFNHVHEHQYSSFEAVVPNYYFRRTKEGVYFNSSGCGNDLASERRMVRKLIIDVCKWWASYYHIDGFRFDLMGIIDAGTINELKNAILAIRPNFMFYGEGWNMMSGYNLMLANADNARHVQFVSFFNDTFRDIAIGNVGSGRWGYALNSGEVHNQFKEVFTGSSFNILAPSRFFHVSCSVNFVECHDNHTLFDKINLLRPNLTLEEKLKRVNFANALTMFSLGIPFFHAGQEIGLSKDNNGNTYNAGDKVNQFKYSLLKERMNMVEYFRTLSQKRKQIRIFHEVNMGVIDRNGEIGDFDNNCVYAIYHTRLGAERTYRKVTILINPTDQMICYNKDATEPIEVPPITVKVVEK